MTTTQKDSTAGRVRAVMAWHNMTAKALADRLGVTRAAVSHVLRDLDESGWPNGKVTRENCATALGVHPTLLDIDGPPLTFPLGQSDVKMINKLKAERDIALSQLKALKAATRSSADQMIGALSEQEHGLVKQTEGSGAQIGARMGEMLVGLGRAATVLQEFIQKFGELELPSLMREHGLDESATIDELLMKVAESDSQEDSK